MILVLVHHIANLLLKIIERDTHVRLKIVGTRVDATEIVSQRFAMSNRTPESRLISVCNRHNQGGPPWRCRVVRCERRVDKS